MKDREKVIRAAALKAIEQARAQKSATISAACKQEEARCRSAIEAVEELKSQYKHAGDKAEKAALKIAVNEAREEMKQAISEAKREAVEQKKMANLREKELIERTKEEEKQAIASLSFGDNPLDENHHNGQFYPDASTETDFEEIDGEWITQTTNEIPFRRGAEQEQFSVTDSEKDELDNPEAGSFEQTARTSSYEDIRKALEESIIKMEEARRARLDFDLPETQVPEPEVSGEAGSMSSNNEHLETLPEAAKTKEISEIVSADSDSIKDNQANGESRSEESPEAAVEEEKAPLLHEGRITITIQNAPSASFTRSFGEKLKQIEDIRIILLGGSSTAGLQVVVLAHKPIPLADQILNLAQVEMTGYTAREIFLRYKSDANGQVGK